MLETPIGPRPSRTCIEKLGQWVADDRVEQTRREMRAEALSCNVNQCITGMSS